MSALAQFLKHEGAIVAGSDREKSPVTDMLEQKGIIVMVPQKAENVPGDADFVVYSDAVPEHNSERTRARELHLKEFSYFQMLGDISKRKRTIAVAGTHGKTTTTGMLTKILVDAKRSPTAIIGSIVRDFDSNYVSGTSNLFIVEACEYRDHLLELSFEILIITNLEWDHTDYFPSLKALQTTFQKAINRVPAHGVIITNPTQPNIAPLLEKAKAKIIDYTKEPAYTLTLPGAFNQENARAAAAAAHALYPALSDTACTASLSAFQGTWRRFEYKGKTPSGVDVYDDYAHHPTAIRETLKALREKTKGNIFIAFHPHLFSRTRDLFDDFMHAFGDADRVFIAPIYAAREKDDGTVSNKIFAEGLRVQGVRAQPATFKEIESLLKKEPREGDVIMTMGAGDIYKVAEKLISK